jgi:uncharacterized protein (DUF58 family)
LIKDWSRAVVSLLVLPIVVTIVAIISSDPALIIAVIFPLAFVAILVALDQKIEIKVATICSQTLVHVGDEITIDSTVKIGRGFGLVLLRLPTSEKFELVGESTNVHVLFKGLKPIDRKYSYRLKALRRGLFKLSDVPYTYYPTLGLINKSEGIFPSGIDIKVLPTIKILRKSQLRVRSRPQVPRQSRTRLGPYSTDFVKIRDYAIGDPYKFVNWKASSRHTNPSKLLVNDYEREGLRTFIFVLDRGELMTHGTPEENPLEYGISFVLSYAKLLLDYNVNVGLWVLPSHDLSSARHYILPSSGTEHYQRIKELLTAAEPSVSNELGDTYRLVPEYQQDPVLIKLTKEVSPAVIIVSNVAAQNVAQLGRLASKFLRLGASVSLLDVMPYSIIAKYGSLTQTVSSSVSLKSLLLPIKRKQQYGILPSGINIISWDPASESIGKAVRTSLSLVRQFF